MQQIEYNLWHLRDELSDVIYKISQNTITNVSWADVMPDEKVKDRE